MGKHFGVVIVCEGEVHDWAFKFQRAEVGLEGGENVGAVGLEGGENTDY